MAYDKMDASQSFRQPLVGKAKPVLKTIPVEDRTYPRYRSLKDLPKETRDYIEMVRDGVRVKWVSVGHLWGQTFKA